MDLQTARTRVKGRYGLEAVSTSDAFFTNTILTDAINEGHRWLAREVPLYYAERSSNVTSGSRSVTVATDVIRIDRDMVRISVNGVWSMLPYLDLRELTRRYGPRENLDAATPCAFTLLSADDTPAASRLALELIPPPNFTGSNLVKYGAYVLPDDYDDDADVVLDPFDPLLYAACWKLAEMELARGDRTAPVGYFERRAREEADDWKKTIHAARRSGPRRVHYRG